MDVDCTLATLPNHLEILESLRKAIDSKTPGKLPSWDQPCVANVDAWRSRTANIYRFSVGSERMDETCLIAKVLPNTSEVTRLYESMEDISDILAQTGEDDTFRPLCYSQELNAVIMPYLSGISLETMLQEKLVSQSRIYELVLSLMNRSGKILAAYHLKFQNGRKENIEEAWNDLESRVCPIVGDSNFAKSLLEKSLVVKSYGDYRPHHLIFSESSGLALIDPPIQEKYVYPHRDVALFIYAVYVSLLDTRSLLRSPFRILRFNKLVSEFLNGYEGEIGEPLSPGDRALISAMQSFLLQRSLYHFWDQKDAVKLCYWGIPMLHGYMKSKRAVVRFKSNSDPIFNNR